MRLALKPVALGLLSGVMLALPAYAQNAPLSIPLQAAIRPAPALSTFLDEMRASLAKGNKPAIDALFAPSVRVFLRDLDPLNTWKETDKVDQKPLATLSRLMFEEGAMPGAPPVDYSGQLIELLGEAFGPDAPLGSMPQVKDGICSPPRYVFDAAKIRQLAKKFGSLTTNVRVAPRALALKASPAPEAKATFTVPAGTALFTLDENNLPEGWGRVALSDGRKAYVDSLEDIPTLHQRHICLGKQGDSYRIIAVFSYGL